MSSDESTVRVPAQIQATEEGDSSRSAEQIATVVDEWDGVLLGNSGPGSGHSGWEVISKELSHCGSSPRSLSSEDMNIVEDGLPPTEGADEVQEDKDEANLDTVDETFTNLDTGSQTEISAESPPRSPRSFGDSIKSDSYSNVSPPDSPAAIPGSDSFEDGSDSEWASDNEGDGSGSRGTRSETDSEEALRDLEALSQEGSLDGLSDSEAQLDDPISFYNIRFLRTPAVASEPFAGFPMSGADSFHTVDSDTVGDAPSEVALLVEGIMEPETAPVSSGKMEVAAAVAAAFVSEPKQLPPLEDEPTDHPVVQDAKLPQATTGKAIVGGLLGLPVRKIVESKVVSTVWAWVKGWTASLCSILSKVLPERQAAILSHEATRLRSCWRMFGWPLAIGGVVATVMGGLLVCAIARNRQLARALHSKEAEMTRLLIKVFSLQEKLAVSRRIPILRHTAHTQKCAFGTFASAPTEFL